MSYAVRLPNRQNLMVPAVALALGFAGATGAYVALDDGFLSDDSNSAAPAAVTAPRVGVSATGVNEASTAAAVGQAAARPIGGVNEASTAAAIGASSAPSNGGVNEASTAAAVSGQSDTAQFLADRGIVLRRSAPPTPGGSRP
jgi:hypothetical protein